MADGMQHNLSGAQLEDCVEMANGLVQACDEIVQMESAEIMPVVELYSVIAAEETQHAHSLDIVSQNADRSEVLSNGENEQNGDEPELDAGVIDAAATGDKKRSRKRLRQPETWARNISKRKRQSGQAYTNSKGITIEKRTMKTVNCSKCSRQCTSKFSEEERQHIFNGFWALSDDAKSSFYGKFTERLEKSRKKTKKPTSSREFTISYFLESNGSKP